jgi:hypothetical protein
VSIKIWNNSPPFSQALEEVIANFPKAWKNSGKISKARKSPNRTPHEVCDWVTAPARGGCLL